MSILNLKKVTAEPIKPLGFIPWISANYCPVIGTPTEQDGHLVLNLANPSIIKPDDTLLVSGLGIGVDGLYSLEDVELTMRQRNSGTLRIPASNGSLNSTTPDWHGAINALKGKEFEPVQIEPKVYRIQRYPVLPFDAFPLSSALRWTAALEQHEEKRLTYNRVFAGDGDDKEDNVSVPRKDWN